MPPQLFLVRRRLAPLLKWAPTRELLDRLGLVIGIVEVPIRFAVVPPDTLAS